MHLKKKKETLLVFLLQIDFQRMGLIIIKVNNGKGRRCGDVQQCSHAQVSLCTYFFLYENTPFVKKGIMNGKNRMSEEKKMKKSESATLNECIFFSFEKFSSGFDSFFWRRRKWRSCLLLCGVKCYVCIWWRCAF